MVVSPTACPSPAPKYADVEPIFKKRCVTCHVTGNKNGYWPLDDYTHVTDWFDTIASNLAACTMPPPDANAPIPREESELILTWLKCGYPR